MSCGLWYSVCLVSIGLCHKKLLNCWLHGRASLEDIEIGFLEVCATLSVLVFMARMEC